MTAASKAVSVDQTIITRSLADRVPSMAKASLALAFYAFLGSWIYSGFAGDLDGMLADFPDELTALMGGSLVGATGGYIGSVMLNMLGPLVFIGIAVSWGAGAIAGEEAGQTARLLFAQPVTRRQVLLDRAIVMAIAIVAGVTIFASSLYVAISLFDENSATLANAAAAGVHLSLFVITIGMIALAAGSATGSKSAGIAAGAGVASVSYFIDAFAPLTAADGFERFTPWYLYNGNDPIDNGFDVGHLAIQLGIAAFFLAIGLWSVTRRDLDPSQTSLIERLPIIGSRSTQRVSTVFARTVSVRAPIAVVAGLALAAMSIAMAILFDSLGASFEELDLPAEMEKALGGSALSTPVGWINAELMSIVAPLVVLGLAISMGLDAVAGERERRTLALVLSAAPSRTRFLVEKLLAMLVIVAVVTVITMASLFVGSGIGGLDLSTSGMLGASAQLGALGLFFGAVATAAGVVLSRRQAFSVAVGLAGASFLSQSLLSAIDGPSWLIKISPWDYYMGNNPLENGLSLTNLAVLLSLTAIAAIAAVLTFERADAA